MLTSSSSRLKAWYKELAKNNNVTERPYITERTNFETVPFETYSKRTVPTIAATKPVKCE